MKRATRCARSGLLASRVSRILSRFSRSSCSPILSPVLCVDVDPQCTVHQPGVGAVPEMRSQVRIALVFRDGRQVRRDNGWQLPLPSVIDDLQDALRSPLRALLRADVIDSEEGALLDAVERPGDVWGLWVERGDQVLDVPHLRLVALSVDLAGDGV